MFVLLCYDWLAREADVKFRDYELSHVLPKALSKLRIKLVIHQYMVSRDSVLTKVPSLYAWNMMSRKEMLMRRGICVRMY
jgi:hypothetical protein